MVRTDAPVQCFPVAFLLTQRKEHVLCLAKRRQLDIPEHDGDAFALETDVSLANVYPGRLVLELAIDNCLYGIAFAGDLIFIPVAEFLLTGVAHVRTCRFKENFVYG